MHVNGVKTIGIVKSKLTYLFSLPICKGFAYTHVKALMDKESKWFIPKKNLKTVLIYVYNKTKQIAMVSASSIPSNAVS